MVSPIRLRLHVTQEVPLPSYFLIAFVTLRTCSAWLGGELRQEVLLLMLSYFGNLVAFCLILKFLKVFLFYSPWLLRKKFQNEKGEIEFLSFYLT